MSATNASRAYRKFKRATNGLLKRNGAAYLVAGKRGDDEASKFLRSLARTVADQIRSEALA
ncbi:hypothetical protein JAB5_27580 [Janthinobacterium sp. HH103]|uniref:hypothetical protein n=1 Tax=unclassified Janthinobacterium TaxID=2610881 RepID=UPI0008757494|nr:MULTISPECIES: hypothetical protein [unclassified Janthinobacterium]OEZ52996.1 hypothetical protein JAB2_58600 [Janthinobacterium sp. HH100]OEZ76449.1 hypothetical protein JAB5_27580 [Janthinobacterium sp. HH103]QOU76183.1 hypothetical protein JAB4_056830 [Janthinobacterium sp. HH102]SIR81073.1 hypothetical protein SAMN05880566_12359 [Janthinobacterium sp. TND4EL3]